MRKNLAVYIAIAVFASAVGAMSGFSQEDITMLRDSTFRHTMRPAVPFAHDEHNEAAEIEECNVCHHSYDAMGRKLEDESSEGTACSECHTSKDNDPLIPLVMAYHLQCKGCHAEKKDGPVMCGECHVR